MKNTVYRSLITCFAIQASLFFHAEQIIAQEVLFSDEILVAGHTHRPSSLYCKDLDGDGDYDLLSASKEDHKIAWYENLDGQGSFGTQQVISTDANYANSVFSADIDGDGDNDVISCSSSDDKIAWYENINGFGTFGPQQIISENTDCPQSVFSADLDEDGDFDVLSASVYDNKIAWYENSDGLGNFGPQRLITTNAIGANCVYSTDLDGDGDNDVLAASMFDYELSWFENIDEPGYFGPQQIISNELAETWSIFCADLDGDNDKDVLATSYWDNKLIWFENIDGVGTIGPEQIITEHAPEASSVYSFDFDGDGDNDVLSASLWYENLDGFGNFGPQQIIAERMEGVNFVLSADFDNDGDHDIVTKGGGNDRIGWYKNLDGNGSFELEQIITIGAKYVRSVHYNDFDGDGDLDVLSGCGQGDKVSWHNNFDSNGSFIPGQAISSSPDRATAVYSSDLDGDGDFDAISTFWSFSEEDDRIVWFDNIDGSGNFSEEQLISSIPAIGESIFSTDLDGDDDNDILLALQTHNDPLVWYENIDGQGTFGEPQQIATLIRGPNCVYCVDIDSDGDNDILTASNDNSISWFENLYGNGSFSFERIISNNALYAESVFSIDIDGDGDLDVLSASPGDNKIAWYENLDGTGNFGIEQIISNNAISAHSVSSADFDLDGDNDVLASFGNIGWFENIDGLGNFGEVQYVTDVVLGYKSAYSVDIDGDNVFDILTSSYHNHVVVWFRNELINKIDSGQLASTYPKSFQVSSVYPNPFNPKTTIEVGLPVSSYLTVSIYNMLGQEVARLFSGQQQAGFYGFAFDGSSHASGIYFARASIDPDVGANRATQEEIRKIVLLK